MGWKDAIKYVKHAVNKHQTQPASKADAGLPLGARIGGIVNLQPNTFIRACANGSLVEIFNGKNQMITAISRVRLAGEGSMYRYYFTTGDTGSEPERFLQVFKDASGQVAEVLFCTTLTRIVPETIEEQKAYTGEDGYGLGEKMFGLSRDDLSAAGVAEHVLTAALGDAEGVEFWRDIGERDADFVMPLHGVETRIDDADGVRGLEQDIVFMPYAREIGETREYLLISTEIVKSKDGDPNKRAIHVDMMLGLPLELDRVTIQ